MGETMLGYLSEIGCYATDVHLTNFVHLHSFHPDKFKYGYTDALGYNKCQIGLNPEVALMRKSINGDKIA